MNIIANNCCGGFIYKDLLKSEYKNPFIWCLIDDDSFLNLISNYEKIDFNKYEIIENENIKNTYILIIDNKIKLQYIHYCKGNTNEIKKIGMDIFYNKMIDRIKMEYECRLKRMILSKDKPIFIFSGLKEEKTNEFYKKLKLYSNKYKIIIFTNQTLDILKTNKNFIIFKTKLIEPSIVVNAFQKELYSILK